MDGKVDGPGISIVWMVASKGFQFTDQCQNGNQQWGSCLKGLYWEKTYFISSSVPPQQVCRWKKAEPGMDGLEGGDAIQRHLDRPEKWDHENHIQFNKAKCKCINIQFVCLYQTIFAQKKGQEVSPRGHISDNSVCFSPWAIRKILLDGKWTPVLGVDVGIFLSMAKLCCLNFFTINLFIWCENGCLPPGFFLLSSCNWLKPHPHLSILAVGSVLVTGSATLWCPQCQL